MSICRIAFIFSLVCLISIYAGKVVELEDGKQVITGKGCGISTTLKYMTELPPNPEQYECVIIQKPQKIPKSNDESKLFTLKECKIILCI